MNRYTDFVRYSRKPTGRSFSRARRELEAEFLRAYTPYEELERGRVSDEHWLRLPVGWDPSEHITPRRGDVITSESGGSLEFYLAAFDPRPDRIALLQTKPLGDARMAFLFGEVPGTGSRGRS